MMTSRQSSAPGSHWPLLTGIRRSTRQSLRQDAIAGATVAAYAIPQVMAYATLAGMPPQTGLWVLAIVIPVYLVFGSSRFLSVGPESTTALLTATTLAPLALGDPGRYASLAALLALIVGVLALVAWLLRLGFIGDLLSRPILIGYMAGVAVIMIASQLSKLTGVPTSGSTLTDELRSFVSGFPEIHLPTLVMGLAVLVSLLVLTPVLPRFPVPLVVVLVATAVTAGFDLTNVGIETADGVSSALPQVSAPTWTTSDIGLLLLPAIGFVLVSFSDNLLTARMFAARRGQAIDANRELLALGATNMASAAFSGFPISASASRSAIALAAGARSQAFGLVVSVGIAFVVLVAGGVLANFPMAALGGLVVFAATRLVDIREFVRLWHFRRREFALAITASVSVLAFGILYGILAAIAISVAELFTRVARPNAAILGQVPGLAGWHDVTDYPDATQIPGLLVFRYDSPLFFANAEHFLRDARAAIADTTPTPAWLLLNMEAIIQVDVTGLDALDQLTRECADLNIVIALVRVKLSINRLLMRHGVGERIGADHIYPTLPTAVEAFERSRAESG